MHADVWTLAHKREVGGASASRVLPVRHLLIILFLAMAISASCDYMNAVNDLVHAYAEYRMLLFLFLVILLMGSLRGIQRILVPVAGAFGALYAAPLHYRANAADLSDPEHAYKNLILFILAAAIAAGTMGCHCPGVYPCTSTLRTEGRTVFPGTSAYHNGKPFMVLMFVFRNGRSWVTILILLFLLFLLRYALWEEKAGTEDLTYGIALQFVFTVVFSLLHRYYFAYLYSRFSPDLPHGHGDELLPACRVFTLYSVSCRQTPCAVSEEEISR